MDVLCSTVAAAGWSGSYVVSVVQDAVDVGRRSGQVVEFRWVGVQISVESGKLFRIYNFCRPVLVVVGDLRGRCRRE